jgi:uncharacterized Fe-S cluster-containing radical SAM superfamily protein
MGFNNRVTSKEKIISDEALFTTIDLPSDSTMLAEADHLLLIDAAFLLQMQCDWLIRVNSK